MAIRTDRNETGSWQALTAQTCRTQASRPHLLFTTKTGHWRKPAGASDDARNEAVDDYASIQFAELIPVCEKRCFNLF